MGTLASQNKSGTILEGGAGQVPTLLKLRQQNPKATTSPKAHFTALPLISVETPHSHKLQIHWPESSGTLCPFSTSRWPGKNKYIEQQPQYQPQSCHRHRNTPNHISKCIETNKLVNFSMTITEWLYCVLITLKNFLDIFKISLTPVN